MNDSLGEILEELKEFVSLEEAIFSDQTGKKPKYPYLTAKIIAIVNGIGSKSKLLVESADENFDFDIQETSIQMPKSTISINIYSKKMEEAYDKAELVKSWFEFYGQEYLQSKNLVVVETTTIENRDAFLIADYERRYGFDVIIRSTKILSKSIENLENYKIEVGGE